MAVSSTQLAAFRTRTRDLHNYLRKKRNGKVMLTLNSNLNATALKAAQYQASRNAMQHTPYWDDAMLSQAAHGENVAGGWATADSVVLQGWRYSCAHYYNMVNGGFAYMGVGVADSSTGKRYWAVHFAGKNTYCGTGNYCCKCVGTGCKSWASNDIWRCPGGSQGCP